MKPSTRTALLPRPALCALSFCKNASGPRPAAGMVVGDTLGDGEKAGTGDDMLCGAGERGDVGSAGLACALASTSISDMTARTLAPITRTDHRYQAIAIRDGRRAAACVCLSACALMGVVDMVCPRRIDGATAVPTARTQTIVPLRLTVTDAAASIAHSPTPRTRRLLAGSARPPLAPLRALSERALSSLCSERQTAQRVFEGQHHSTRSARSSSVTSNSHKRADIFCASKQAIARSYGGR
jgi:hypothetical protein